MKVLAAVRIVHTIQFWCLLSLLKLLQNHQSLPASLTLCFPQYHGLINLCVPLQVSTILTHCVLSVVALLFQRSEQLMYPLPLSCLQPLTSVNLQVNSAAVIPFLALSNPLVRVMHYQESSITFSRFSPVSAFPSFSFECQKGAQVVFALLPDSIFPCVRCFLKCLCSSLPGSSGNSCSLSNGDCFRKSLMVSSFLILHLLAPIATLSLYSGTTGSVNLLCSKDP